MLDYSTGGGDSSFGRRPVRKWGVCHSSLFFRAKIRCFGFFIFKFGSSRHHAKLKDRSDMVWTNKKWSAFCSNYISAQQMRLVPPLSLPWVRPQKTKTPQPVSVDTDTPDKKRARISCSSWDPDDIPKRCEPLEPNERRLVDIDTKQGICSRKLCGCPITSRNYSQCAFHGKHFVPTAGKDKDDEKGKQQNQKANV